MYFKNLHRYILINFDFLTKFNVLSFLVYMYNLYALN